jgi:hypothetical protein
MLFPLGTGIERATNQRTLSVIARAKQASVLFDEILFESGLLAIDVFDHSSPPFVRRVGRGRISSKLLINSRQVVQGTKGGIAVRTADGQVEIYAGIDLPRLADASYFERDVEFRYISEHHSDLLDVLADLNADWVKVLEVKGNAGARDVSYCPLERLVPTGDELPPRIVRIPPEQAIKLVADLQQDTAETSSERTRASKARDGGLLEFELERQFAEAAERADALNAAFNITGAFRAIAEQRGAPLSMPGEEALEILVPNLTVLDWDAIAAFRKHPAAKQARERLAEFESRAAADGFPGSKHHIRSTSREVTEALLTACSDLKPDLPKETVRAVGGSAIGFVPVVGAAASLAVSVSDLIAAARQHHEFSGSWLAAVFELREEVASATLG